MIDPIGHQASDFAAKTHSPAVIYHDGKEQHQAVDRIIETLLGRIHDVSRSQIAALEWSVNEMTDNVLNHSESSIGGIVQVTPRRNGTMVEVVVCDAGIGIPRSLRSAHKDITSDISALDRSIREGVTKNKLTNMGNGLFGSYRIAQISGGHFKIHSGYATLKFDQKRGMHVRENNVPFAGTLISCSINCADPEVLSDSLVFKGKVYKPSYTYFDRIEDDEIIAVRITDETSSFGTREASRPIRLKIENLIENSKVSIEIDLSGVDLISSSFADEVFGKNCAFFGQTIFFQRVKILNANRLVSQLIERAISQRMALAESLAT